jgi:phosphoribosylformylglycinamidine cyclo-ligase
VALAVLADRGVGAWVAGEILERGDRAEAVALTGDYSS